jgi:Flp pilus assembly protein TadD
MTDGAQGHARVRVMIDLRRYDEALGVLGSLVAADPGDGMAWCLVAAAHLGAGRYEKAAHAAARAIDAAPAEDWPYRLASLAHLRRGNALAALRAAEEARRLALHQWRCHLSVAQATLATGEHFDQAEQAAAAARQLAPNEPDVHCLSGKVSLARGRVRKARAH